VIGHRPGQRQQRDGSEANRLAHVRPTSACVRASSADKQPRKASSQSCLASPAADAAAQPRFCTTCKTSSNNSDSVSTGIRKAHGSAYTAERTARGSRQTHRGPKTALCTRSHVLVQQMRSCCQKKSALMLHRKHENRNWCHVASRATAVATGQANTSQPTELCSLTAASASSCRSDNPPRNCRLMTSTRQHGRRVNRLAHELTQQSVDEAPDQLPSKVAV
jgi:hypothetical protein